MNTITLLIVIFLTVWLGSVAITLVAKMISARIYNRWLTGGVVGPLDREHDVEVLRGYQIWMELRAATALERRDRSRPGSRERGSASARHIALWEQVEKVKRRIGELEAAAPNERSGSQR